MRVAPEYKKMNERVGKGVGDVPCFMLCTRSFYLYLRVEARNGLTVAHPHMQRGTRGRRSLREAPQSPCDLLVRKPHRAYACVLVGELGTHYGLPCLFRFMP
jgi:hypothetical protein